MSTLGISQMERLVSRMGFYLLVGVAMWSVNRYLPDTASIEHERWTAMGVVEPMIAVPVSR